LSIIDNKEYWDLNGILPVQVKLTWDENTDVTTLADDSSSLRVVGFSTVLDKWVDLGNAEVTGDASNGVITSGVFVPDDFSALTLGSVLKGNGDIVVYTGVTPNGDGLNDTFIVEGLEASPDNELYLYNRWGVQVFYMKNYDNSFDGTSEGRTTYNAAKKLPAGTYYYLLNLKDREDRSGFFYITR
jgi:gliding motility-associated-like protein